MLPLFAAAVILVAITNPMGLDKTQRATGSIALIFAAYFAAHTLHNYLKSPAVPPHPAPPVAVPHDSSLNLKVDSTVTKPESPQQPIPKRGRPRGSRTVSPLPQSETPKLPVAKLQFTTETAPSKREDAPFAVKVVIQTNVPLQPTSLVVECDVEPKAVEHHLVGWSTFRDMGTGYAGTKSNFWIFWGDPVFRPETPFIVLLMADRPIHVLNVRYGPPPPGR